MVMKPVYILGTPGFIRNPEGRPMVELLELTGANTGNLMFQAAVAGIIGGEKRFIGKANVSYSEAGGCGNGSYLVFPAANHLRAGIDWSGLCGFFEKSRVPLVIIGLGAQADSTADPRKTAEVLRGDASVMRLVNVLRDKAAWISVRGAFTAEVCGLLGMPEVEVLGCPSLMINPHADAGKRIGAKLAAAVKMRRPALALAAATPFDIRNTPVTGIERILFRHAREANGLYVQQAGKEAVALSLAELGHLTASDLLSIRDIVAPGAVLDDFIHYFRERGRFFTSAEQWIREMGFIDFCFGTRLHGNMAAVAAGVPGCVISHDSRTDELAEQMMLPRLGAADVTKCKKLRDLISRTRFDPAAFDRSRREKAAGYTAAFRKLGLEPRLPLL